MGTIPGNTPKVLRVVCTTAAQATSLAAQTSPTAFSYAMIQAHPTNTGAVYVGNNAAVATLGIHLASASGDMITVSMPREWDHKKMFDLRDWWINAAIVDEGVNVIYFD